MELSQFKAMNQKQKLSYIAQMRREVEAAIRQVHTSEDFIKPEIDEYAELHRTMRSEILSPTPVESYQLSPFAEAFFALKRSYLTWMKMLDKKLADLEEEAARQRIDAAVERKVSEKKNKGGRPKVGDKKGITVRMPDDEWQPIRAVINYYGYTDAEFFAEAARLLAAQRIESLEPYQIEHYGAKDFGS